MIKLIAGDFTLDAAKGDAPRRTISGTAVPYNVPATVSDGTAVIFRPGSLPVEGKAPRLFMYHDASMPVGVVTERVDTEQGMMFSAKISATSLGNDALVGVRQQALAAGNNALYDITNSANNLYRKTLSRQSGEPQKLSSARSDAINGSHRRSHGYQQEHGKPARAR